MTRPGFGRLAVLGAALALAAPVAAQANEVTKWNEIAANSACGTKRGGW